MMNNLIVIGSVAKPQGVKGELKIVPLTDDAERFKKLKRVLIEGKNYTVSQVKIGGGFVFLSLLEITDRNLAETFRGKQLCVEREDAVSLKEGSYFIVDIIGCELYSADKKIGEVIDLVSAHTDIFVVKCENGKIMRFPFLKRVIKEVDTTIKKIIVFPDKLEEVCVYED